MKNIRIPSVNFGNLRSQPGIDLISPYVPGSVSSSASDYQFHLASNETPLGASQDAIDAFISVASHLDVYPEGGCSSLRSVLGAHHGIDWERIICGAGSDEILSLLGQAYIGPGDEVIYTRHGFLMYEIITHSNGGVPVIVEEVSYRADIEAILSMVGERTRLIFLANPNNPTGSYVSHSELLHLCAHLPPSCLLVLDAAYAEYVGADDYESGLGLVDNFSNVFMTRTFSKIYGLAGLRLGWGYGPSSVIDTLHRIRGPFNVNSAAQSAGISALGDNAHIARSVSHNEKWRTHLTDHLQALGICVSPSVGNFILLHFPVNDEVYGACAADSHLRSCGILLRRMDAYHLPDCLRMTVGGEEANIAVLSALEDFMK